MNPDDQRLATLAESKIGRLALACDDAIDGVESIQNDDDVFDTLVDDTVDELPTDNPDDATATVERVVAMFLAQVEEYAELVDSDDEVSVETDDAPDRDAPTDTAQTSLEAAGNDYKKLPASHRDDRKTSPGTNHHFLLDVVAQREVTSNEVRDEFDDEFPGNVNSVNAGLRRLFDRGDVKRRNSSGGYQYKITEKGRERLAEIGRFDGGVDT